MAEDPLEYARSLAERLRAQPTNVALGTSAVELLRSEAGLKSTFHEQAAKTLGYGRSYLVPDIPNLLEAWANMVEAGHGGSSQDVISRHLAANDLMEQVEALLNDARIHPAAPVVLAGAALEEFLRALADRSGVQATGKRGIDAYAKALRSADAITAQAVKDITAWAGLRNQAAHGQFAQVSVEAARIMALGINLFMQQHA
jgi:hypothetical protein